VKDLCEESSSQDDGAGQEESCRGANSYEINGADVGELQSTNVAVEELLESESNLFLEGDSSGSHIVIVWETDENEVIDVVACVEEPFVNEAGDEEEEGKDGEEGSEKSKLIFIGHFIAVDPSTLGKYIKSVRARAFRLFSISQQSRIYHLSSPLFFIFYSSRWSWACSRRRSCQP